MRCIFKYHLEVGLNPIDMPLGAKGLCVMMQKNRATLWVEAHASGLTPTTPRVKKRVMVVGTGQPFSQEGFVYVGSVQTFEGFVWHVYMED